MGEEEEVAYANDEDLNESGTFTEVLDILSNMRGDEYSWTPDFSPVKPITKLNIGRYVGRWYQVREGLIIF